MLTTEESYGFFFPTAIKNNNNLPREKETKNSV